MLGTDFVQDITTSHHIACSLLLTYYCHTNLCFSAPLPPPLTEQQATITIPGTNLTIPISALTGNQSMITIPGTNISIPGLQANQTISIPTSQAISIPCSSAGVTSVDKQANGKDTKSQEGSPNGQGWCFGHVWRLFSNAFLIVNVTDKNWVYD